MIPYILASLILVLVLALGCTGAIRRHAPVLYALATVFVVFEVLYYRLGLRDLAPEWVTQYLINPFKRGALPTALFVLVMFAGALDSRRPGVRRLLSIRGELSILACILTLGHNIVYGGKHFVRLFTAPAEMQPNVFAAAVLSIVLIALMLPLMVTSFRFVRRRMSAVGWKKLQRLAYPFFGLTYVHILLLFAPKFEQKAADTLIYTLIFGSYLICRVAKAARVRRTRRARLSAAAPIPAAPAEG